MKTKIKYGLISLLVLFAAINTAVGRTDASAVAGVPGAVHSPAPGNKDAVDLEACLPDLSLCNTQVPQTGSNLAYKRMLGDKDLLLLHAGKVSNAVKANSGDHLRFADSLTHIFLFLFPYHFFW